MQIGSKQWIDHVVRAGNQLGIQISSGHAAQFALHARELLAWNQKFNLTAVTDPADMAIKHYVDSLAPMNYIPANAKLLDMGTGSGFPGLPLKIMRPQQSMVLIDSMRKKITFVRHIIRMLDLRAIEALQVRAQDLARDPAYQKRFDVIICRALSDLSMIAGMAAPLLTRGGTLIALKGPKEARNSNISVKKDQTPWLLEDAKYCFRVTAIRYHLPFLGDLRSILLLKSR